MNIIKVSAVVKQLLTDQPKTRDSDNLLILKVWAEQNSQLRGNDYPFRRFAIEFVRGNYPSTESITRARRKIQEEFPSLRGASYKARQNHQEDVKDQLRSPELLAGGTP